jgi:23S rRNA pseudouridine955/2504/2580 synthase
MRSGSLDKHYRLIVRGRWPKDLHRVDAPLHKYVAASGERRVRVSSEGKPSLTTFEVTAYAHAATLLRAQLHTGRTHQIRVHARHAGHSLLGDEKYADDAERAWDRAEGIGRLCLHAERIALPDGAGVFEAPEPNDFRRIWQRLAGSASAAGVAEDGHSGALQHPAQSDEG